MIVKLTNFRCWEDKTFNLSDKGMILLSGASGAGKSSLLNAIYFCLFGVGVKVKTYNKKSCKVEIYFEDFHVVRSKNPNRLLLNDIYENDVAQAMIDKKFGKHFGTTSYLRQNNYKSFILLNPTEKLLFLEYLVFENIDTCVMKEKIKQEYRNRASELSKCVGRIEEVSKIVDSFSKPVKRDFDLKFTDMKTIENEKSICTNRLEEYRKQYTRMNKDMEVYKLAKQYIRLKEAELDVINKKIKSTEDELNELKFNENKEFELRTILEDTKSEIEYLKIKKELIDLELCYEEERGVLSNQIDDLVKMQNEKEYENNITLINKLQDQLQGVRQLSTLKSRINKKKLSETKKKCVSYEGKLKTLEEDISLCLIEIENKRIRDCQYTCPECEVLVEINDENVLVKSHNRLRESECTKPLDLEALKREKDGVISEISVLQKYILKKKMIIMEIKELEEKQEDLREEDIIESIGQITKENKEYEERLNRISYYKSSLKSLSKKNVNSKKVLTEKLKKYRNSSNSLSVLYKDYKKYSVELEEYLERSVQYKYLSECLEDYRSKRDDLGLNLGSKIESLQEVDEEELIKIESKINESETVLRELQNQIILLHEYTKYRDDCNNYDHWTRELSKLRESELKYTHLLNSISKLKEFVLESEMLCISNMITTLNIYAEKYLELFFESEPLSCVLSTHKTSKLNTKPQINTQINYKGMECDISMLSGGELDRVILAYTLALSELQNSQMLMLDECTSSLDQETTDTILHAISENYKGKMIILIGHQIIKGSFDQIVKV